MSGMRVGEALALTWEDITKDNVKVSKTISL
jgi:integrase